MAAAALAINPSAMLPGTDNFAVDGEPGNILDPAEAVATAANAALEQERLRVEALYQVRLLKSMIIEASRQKASYCLARD